MMRRSALVVLSILAISCSAIRATPEPSELASVTPSVVPSAVATPTFGPTPSPEMTSTPEATESTSPSSLPTPPLATPIGPSPSASSATDATTLDPDEIRTIPIDVADGYPGTFAQEDSRVAFLTSTFKDTREVTSVVLADVATGETTTIAQTHGRERILSVDLSGNYLVWATGRWEYPSTGNIPCGEGGPMSWAVFARDLASGVDNQLAAGTNTDYEGCGAFFASISIDGDLVAYAVEDHAKASNNASTIVVRSLSSGEVVRTIDTDLYVEQVDLSGDDVAFIAGRLSDDPYADLDSPRLGVSTADSPAISWIAKDQYVDTLSFSNGRLAWLAYLDNSEQIWTADVRDLKPVALTNDGDRRYSDPYSTGDYVTWVEASRGANFGTQIDIWSREDSAIHSVVPFPYGIDPGQGEVWTSSSSGDWLVWAGSIYQSATEMTEVLQGCPMSDAVGLP